MRYLAFPCCVAASLFFFSEVASAEQPSPDPTASNAYTIETSTGLGWVRNQSWYEPYAPYYFFEVAPSYRLSRLVSIGAAASYADTIAGGGLHFWRFAGEARLHAVRTRAFDAWVGGEVGMAVTSFAPAACGDCGSPTPSDVATHVEPLFGAGIGIDVLPVPYFTLGLEGRGMLVVFGNATDHSMPSGTLPAVFFGLTLGANVPLGS